MRKGILLMLILTAATIAASASDTIPSGLRRSISLHVSPAYAFSSYLDDILSSTLDMNGVRKTELATSLNLNYGFSFPSDSEHGRISARAIQGIGVGVNFFGNFKGLGSPVSVYAFQGAPIWRFSEKLSAYYEWNFGASFGWHPCRGDIARSNLIVGSSVNAYINLGIGLAYRLGNQFSLMAGINLTHFSNGNTSFPNPGVNLAGVRIGVERMLGADGDSGRGLGKSDCVAGTSSAEDCIPNCSGKRPELDLTLYGAWRRRVYRGGETPVLLNGRFAIAGLDFATMWRLTRNFRAGASADFQWDESTDLRRHHLSGETTADIRFSHPSFFSQVCVGLSGRAELVMPVFSVNVGIGYNLVGPEETRASYQLACLKIRLTDALFINVGYQLLNFRKQNNLMLGLGYTFATGK